MEFTPIETQEAFDAAIKERLERQKKSVTAEVTKQYEGYVSPEDAKKQADQIAQLTKQVSDLTAKNTAFEQSALKAKIAHEKGLPFELADRLTGTTEDELRKDADMLSQFTAGHQPPPQFSPEKPVSASMDAAFLALANDLNQ